MCTFIRNQSLNISSPIKCYIKVIFPPKIGNTIISTKGSVSKYKYCITSGIFMVVWDNCAEPVNTEMSWYSHVSKQKIAFQRPG